jgi:hypothetical protein
MFHGNNGITYMLDLCKKTYDTLQNIDETTHFIHTPSHSVPVQQPNPVCPTLTLQWNAPIFDPQWAVIPVHNMKNGRCWTIRASGIEASLWKSKAAMAAGKVAG